jgi:hypothetical protein
MVFSSEALRLSVARSNNREISTTSTCGLTPNTLSNARIFLILEHILADHLPGCETWVHNWVRNGWKTAKGADVINKSLIRYLVALLEERIAMGLKVCKLKLETNCPIHARSPLSVPAGSRQRSPRHLWQRASGPSSRRGHAQAERTRARLGRASACVISARERTATPRYRQSWHDGQRRHGH